MTKSQARYWLDHFEDNFAAVLMGAITVVLTLQVVTRYVLNDPLSWTEEVSRHLFVWMVFFGASGAIRDRTHVSVEILAARLPSRARLAVAIGSNLMALFFLGNVLYWGAKAVGRMWSVPTVTLEIPIGLVYTVLPISAALMIVRTLIQMRQDIRAGGNIRKDIMASMGALQ